MKVYKLTDQKYTTYNGTVWGPGVTNTAREIGRAGLCSAGWIHFYEHPLLAVMLNPIHASFESPVLWEAVAEGRILRERGLKAGCRKLTTVRRLKLPAVTPEQRIRFAILCASKVMEDKQAIAWARAWLSGEDRSARSAEKLRETSWSLEDWASDKNELVRHITSAVATPHRVRHATARAVEAAANLAKKELNLKLLVKKAMRS